MKVTNKRIQRAAVVRHCDNGFGSPGSAEYSLVKGKAYTFSLRWVATNLDGGPDYDWRAKINYSTEAGAYSGLYGTGAFIVEDPDDLLTDETHGNAADITLGRTGRIIVPKIVTETVATSPPDRARKTIGVGEEVVLRVLPEGIAVSLWAITQGGGDLSYYSGSTTTYTAPGAEDDVTITASIGGADCSVDFSVIEPSSFTFENTSLVPPELHLPTPTENWMHIHYYADMYLYPDTVNFYNVRLYEGESDPFPVGYFTLYRHGMQKHQSNGPHNMTATVVPGKGTLCVKSDEIMGIVELNHGPIDGFLYWDLLWESDIPNGTRSILKLIRQNNHIAWVNGEQVFTVTKNGSGYFASTNQPLQAVSE